MSLLLHASARHYLPLPGFPVNMLRANHVSSGLDSIMAHVRLPSRNFHRVFLACSLPWSPTIATRTFASRRAAAISNHQGLDSEEDLTAAREWVAKLNSKAITIPRDICEFSFSRSSGPGGQNVNKVNSKATLRVSLESLLPLVPQVLHSPLLASRYVAARNQSLVIQSEESRRQTANLESCYDKLHQLLKSLADDNIPGETSQEQRDRVQRLRKLPTKPESSRRKCTAAKRVADGVVMTTNNMLTFHHPITEELPYSRCP
ncbi:hypothetical protein ASPCADRAFT_129715, partial [Aspergillus carbonarius ITEM 5010]